MCVCVFIFFLKALFKEQILEFSMGAFHFCSRTCHINGKQQTLWVGNERGWGRAEAVGSHFRGAVKTTSKLCLGKQSCRQVPVGSSQQPYVNMQPRGRSHLGSSRRPDYFWFLSPAPQDLVNRLLTDKWGGFP